MAATVGGGVELFVGGFVGNAVGLGVAPTSWSYTQSHRIAYEPSNKQLDSSTYGGGHFLNLLTQPRQVLIPSRTWFQKQMVTISCMIWTFQPTTATLCTRIRSLSTLWITVNQPLASLGLLTTSSWMTTGYGFQWMSLQLMLVRLVYLVTI